MKNNDSVSYVKKNTGKKHRGYMHQLQILFWTEKDAEVRKQINWLLSQFGYTNKDKIELIDIVKQGSDYNPREELEFRINNQYNIKLILWKKSGHGLEITLADESKKTICYKPVFKWNRASFCIEKLELLEFEIASDDDLIKYSFDKRHTKISFEIQFREPRVDKTITIFIDKKCLKNTTALVSYFMNMKSPLTIDEIYKVVNTLLCNKEDISLSLYVDHFPSLCRESTCESICIFNGIPTEITLMDKTYYYSINNFGGTIKLDPSGSLFYYRPFSNTAENVKEKMPEYSEELKSIIQNLINRAITILGDKANDLFSEYVKQEDEDFMKNYQRGFIEEPIEEYAIEPQNKNATDGKALVRKLVKKEIKNFK